MKVLYIGVYRDETGWAHGAINNILALDAADVDVVPRPLKLNNVNGEIPDRIKELEERSSEGCDVVIQHVLPHHMTYDGHFKKNIGVYYTETSNFIMSGWSKHLNIMDEVWVCNDSMVETAKQSRVKVPIRVVPISTDVAKYEEKYEKLDFGFHGSPFIFYTVGEMVKRKNLPALLKAFHLEFGHRDNVKLVIKGSWPGKSTSESEAIIRHQCDSIKQALKLYPHVDDYLEEHIITDRYTEHQMMQLHASCDCFVMTSYGEAWCTLPNTDVYTNDREVRIDEIKNGCLVLTHNGRFRKVTNVLKRQYSGDIYDVKVKGVGDNLFFTKGHKHLILQRDNKRFNKVCIRDPKFVNVEDIKRGDFIAIPKVQYDYDDHEFIQISDFINVELDDDGMIICDCSYNSNPTHSLCDIANVFSCSSQTVSKAINNKSNSKLSKRIRKYFIENNIEKNTLKKIPNKIFLSPHFMFFIGHYIAEGSFSCRHIDLATHINEDYGRSISKNAMLKTFGLNGTECLSGCSDSCIMLRFYNVIVGKFLRELCGDNCKNKFIHKCLKGSKNIGWLLSGIFYGDGSFYDKKLRFYTNSKLLKYDIMEVMKNHDIFCRYNIDKRSENLGYVIQPIQQHIQKVFDLITPYKYNLKLQCPKFVGQRFLLENNKYFFVPIRCIQVSNYDGLVYNISVEDDESYVIYGCATHNCIPAFDAMGMGNKLICSDTGGPHDYLTKNNDIAGVLVPVRKEPVMGVTDSFRDLFTGRELWDNIDVTILMNDMRRMYEGSVWDLDQIKSNAMNRAYDYSHHEIGIKMKEILDE